MVVWYAEASQASGNTASDAWVLWLMVCVGCVAGNNDVRDAWLVCCWLRSGCETRWQNCERYVAVVAVSVLIGYWVSLRDGKTARDVVNVKDVSNAFLEHQQERGAWVCGQGSGRVLWGRSAYLLIAQTFKGESVHIPKRFRISWLGGLGGCILMLCKTKNGNA